MNKRKICIALTAACAVLLVIYEFFAADIIFSSVEDETVRDLIDMTVTRMLGGIIFTVILVYLRYKVTDPFVKPFWSALAFSLPAFLVAVNNFPFSTAFKGEAIIDSPWQRIVLLALECFSVAYFEEMAFRGVILLGFAEKRRDNRLGLFISIVLSSAVFGAVHLLNIFTSSPIAVIMQIGYSFLIGSMCSVVLLKTSNIWLCIVIHAFFNFNGALVPICGEGILWDTFTVIWTVVIAVAVFAYMLVAFLRLDVRETDRIYENKG